MVFNYYFMSYINFYMTPLSELNYVIIRPIPREILYENIKLCINADNISGMIKGILFPDFWRFIINPNTKIASLKICTNKELIDYIINTVCIDNTPDVIEKYVKKPSLISGKKKKTKHRCDDHLEDIFVSIFEERSTIFKATKVYYKCVTSREGQEPKRIRDREYD